MNAWLNNLYPVPTETLEPLARFVKQLPKDSKLRMRISQILTVFFLVVSVT